MTKSSYYQPKGRKPLTQAEKKLRKAIYNATYSSKHRDSIAESKRRKYEEKLGHKPRLGNNQYTMQKAIEIKGNVLIHRCI